MYWVALVAVGYCSTGASWPRRGRTGETGNSTPSNNNGRVDDITGLVAGQPLQSPITAALGTSPTPPAMDLSLGQQNSRPRPRQEETAKGKSELDLDVSGEAARATHQTKFYPPIPPFQSLLPATSHHLSTATTILTSDTPASQVGANQQAVNDEHRFRIQSSSVVEVYKLFLIRCRQVFHPPVLW